MLDDLVNAYSNRDGTQIKALLNSPFIKHMDVEFAILAKSLAEKWIEEPVCLIIVLICFIVMFGLICYSIYFTF